MLYILFNTIYPILFIKLLKYCNNAIVRINKMEEFMKHGIYQDPKIVDYVKNNKAKKTHWFYFALIYLSGYII